MKYILKRQLITPGNYPRVAARIVPQDQRDAIRPGIRISHYSFTSRQGQQGYIIVCHTTRRAGISFADELTQWGRWCDETCFITTDSGRQFTRLGDEAHDVMGQDSAHEAMAR
jgi:hypothetical protein